VVTGCAMSDIYDYETETPWSLRERDQQVLQLQQVARSHTDDPYLALHAEDFALWTEELERGE